MAEYRQLEDGSYVQKRASGWEPVSAETVKAADEGRLHRLGRAAVESGLGLGHGVNELYSGAAGGLARSLGFDDLGETVEGFTAEERAARQQNEAEIEAIAEVDPAASLGRFVPDLLLGGAAGKGAGLGVRSLAGAEGLVGGLTGAASNPDNPLLGATVGAVTGAAGGAVAGAVGSGVARLAGRSPATERALDVMTMSRGQRRGMRQADAILDTDARRAAAEAGDSGDSLLGETGPPGSMTGVDPRAIGAASDKGWVARTSRALGGEAPDDAFVAEAAELGFRLTPGVARGSKPLRAMEAALESQPGGYAAFEPLRTQNENVLKDLVAKGLGVEGGDLTPAGLGAARDQLEGTFERLGSQIGEVDLTPTGRKLNALVEGIDDPVVRTWIEAIGDRVPAKMNGDALMKRLSKWRADADSHWQGKGGDRGKAEALDDLADIVERQMLSQAPKQVKSTLKDASQRWRLMRTVERSGVIDNEGVVKPAALHNALNQGYKNEYRYDRKTGHADIDRLFRGANVAYRMRDIVGNSGTATRSQGPIEALTTGQLTRGFGRAYLDGVDLDAAGRMAVGGTLGIGGAAGIGGSALGGLGLLGD